MQARCGPANRRENAVAAACLLPMRWLGFVACRRDVAGQRLGDLALGPRCRDVGSLGRLDVCIRIGTAREILGESGSGPGKRSPCRTSSGAHPLSGAYQGTKACWSTLRRARRARREVRQEPVQPRPLRGARRRHRRGQSPAAAIRRSGHAMVGSKSGGSQSARSMTGAPQVNRDEHQRQQHRRQRFVVGWNGSGP